jgi:hypothetical protein
MDKQELPINNPAERLYVILTRAAESSPESSIADVLCTSMELETNDENFIIAFSQLIGLLEIIEEQIKHFSTRKQDGIRASIKDIRIHLFYAIQLNYMNNTNNNKFSWKNAKCLNDTNWTTLKSFNGYVDDFESYGISISNDLLNKLINDVDIWIKEINESQLDEDVKKFFIHKFMEIKHLLEKYYYYYGSSRIKTEIYATMVEIGIYQENLTEDKKEESRSFFNTSFEKLSKWAGVVNAPMNTVVIADKLLPIISQTAELVVDKVKHLLPPGI